MNTEQTTNIERIEKIINTAAQLVGSAAIRGRDLDELRQHWGVIEPGIRALQAERDEALRVRDLAREASQRDLEAKRAAEARVKELGIMVDSLEEAGYLTDVKRLAAEARVAELERAIGVTYDLLEAVLPRIGHPDRCVKVRPAEEWLEHGSMDFSGCSCVVAKINAALKARATESGEPRE